MTAFTFKNILLFIIVIMYNVLYLCQNSKIIMVSNIILLVKFHYTTHKKQSNTTHYKPIEIFHNDKKNTN